MALGELNIFTVDVRFHPAAINEPGQPLFTFRLGDLDIPPGSVMSISVPSGIAMIVFTLTTEPGGSAEAFFQTVPVQWLGTGIDGGKLGNPVAVPGMFSFDRLGENTVRLIDFNSNQSTLLKEKTHWFNLLVSYGGNTFSADPSIVNLPPGG